MTYTADISMFPYFKKEIDYKKLYEESQEENKELKFTILQSKTDSINKEVHITMYKAFVKDAECKNKKLQEKVDEGLEYKELKELYEGRANGMEEELNKIKKIVKIKEGIIPEPNEVLNAVKKLNEENKELKEFKEKAEDECEASAVVNDMMGRIEKADREKEMCYNKYKDQEPRMKAYEKENNNLAKVIVGDYKLDEGDNDWENRMCNFYNQVMSMNNDIDWLDILGDVGIRHENWEGIKDYFEDDTDIRERYCEETQGDEEEAPEEWNSIVVNSDWDECEDSFIEWYLKDYCKFVDWWCDYDSGYWGLEEDN